MNMLTQDDLQAIGQLIEEKAFKPLSGQIEDLRTHMNTRFEGVNARIDGVQAEMDTKFDAVQEQLDSIENRFDGVEAKMEVVEGKIDSVENRMLTLDKLDRFEVSQTERFDRRYVRR